MNPWRYVFVASCFMAVPAVAADLETAAALYEGRAGVSAGTVMMGAAGLPAARFPCKGCHGRGGRGGGESGAPPIEGLTLFGPTPERAAYDDNALAIALSEGRTPAGRNLSMVMPRYALSNDVMAGLAAYLRDLPVRERRGVTADDIVFAVPAPPGAESFSRKYAALLEARLRQSAGLIYGRKVRVIAIAGDSAGIAEKADASALAVVAMPQSAGVAIEDFVKRGLPVLLPIAPLAGDEDETLVRGLSASWRDIAKSLAEELNRRTVGTLLVIGDDPAHPVLKALRQEAWKGSTTFAVPDDVNRACQKASDCAVLLLSGDRAELVRQLLSILPAYTPIFVPSSVARREILDPIGSDRDGAIVVEAPEQLNLSISKAMSAMETHADTAAAVLAEALRREGPDPTRSGLVASINDISLPSYRLDYRTARLLGSRNVTMKRFSSLGRPD